MGPPVLFKPISRLDVHGFCGIFLLLKFLTLSALDG